MKHLFIGLAALCYTGVAHAQINNTAIECTSNPTYHPRGDRWASEVFVEEGEQSPSLPYGPVPVIYQIHSGGSDDISNAAEMEAIQRAANAWGFVQCTEGDDESFPSVWLARGADHPTRDRGDTSSSLKNIVYWIEDSSKWLVDSNTIAVTTNNFASATGLLTTSDMEFNGASFSFRAKADGASSSTGCSTSGSNANKCYDVEVVALHEFGHFLGLNHVQCADAVMFPNGTPTGGLVALSEHELTGVCDLYPPRPQSTAQPTFGEYCSTNIQVAPACSSGLTCVIEDGGWNYGWCSKSCTSDSSCGDGYVCKTATLGGVSKSFCKPGVKTSTGGGGGGTDIPPPPDDLCHPCSGSADCGNGLCIDTESEAGGICTQGCGPAAGGAGPIACPSGMECVETQAGINVCFPSSASSCGGGPLPSTVGLNEVCYQDLDDDAKPEYLRFCGGGLVCAVFRPQESGREGACVPYCNNSNAPCPDINQTCCFGIRDDGSCVSTIVDPQNPSGGCFDIRREGESCVLAEQSICEDGTTCAFFENPALAKCFGECPNTTECSNDQYCVGYGDNNDTRVCCQSDDFDQDQTCNPAPDTALQVGVECKNNGDCDSGLCLKYKGEAACSRTCNPVTSTGCPGDDADVDGDGRADGGFNCLLISGEGRCWPKQGPIPVNDGDSSAPDGGCCNAMDKPMRPGDVAWQILMWLPFVVAHIRRRRRATGAPA